MTPVQLWVNGLLQLRRSNHRVVQELRERVSNIKCECFIRLSNAEKGDERTMHIGQIRGVGYAQSGFSVE